LARGLGVCRDEISNPRTNLRILCEIGFVFYFLSLGQGLPER